PEGTIASSWPRRSRAWSLTGSSTSRIRGVSGCPILRSSRTCDPWEPSRRWSSEYVRLAVSDDDLRHEPWPVRGLLNRGNPGRDADRSVPRTVAVGSTTAWPEPPGIAAKRGGPRRVLGRSSGWRCDRRADRRHHPE